MREISGKLVYDTLAEVIRPRHTALLVVDMQNEFCSPDGVPGKNGADVSPVRAIIPNVQKLIVSARASGVRVIFFRHTHEPDLRNLSPARLSFYAMLYGGKISPYHAIRGSWGHAIVSELAPADDETVIDKDRSSAFIATNLDLILRSNRIESVVVTGMATHACVESTARDAGFFDYYTVVAIDCVADYSPQLHEASLLTLRNRCLLAGSDEIMTGWRASDAASKKRSVAG